VAGARAWFEPGQPVLVWNADILTDASTETLLELARSEDAQVLLVSEREGGAGTVGLDREGNVVRLRGRVFGVEARSADYVGIMALGPSIVSALPERGCLIGDVALPALAAGQRIRTVTHGSRWTDLGDVASYLAANLTWLGERRAWVGGGAVVADGVSLERAIVGAGAQVTGAGELSEVVVWPGAQVTAPLRRAVVLGSGQVVPVAETAEN
jgi:NDP-sugar pyrophosphorylase family protein